MPGRSILTISCSRPSNCSKPVERVRNFYSRKFRFVLVDEYQDTNRPQYMLVRRLAEFHRNLCVVGDPDQSIYKWRGADLRNILDFEHDFPDVSIVKLEQNYRSTQVILDAATAVISRNRNRKDKKLWTEQEAARASSITAPAMKSRKPISSRRGSAKRRGNRPAR
jgi:superfamily I DNA/RNA helicase